MCWRVNVPFLFQRSSARGHRCCWYLSVLLIAGAVGRMINVRWGGDDESSSGGGECDGGMGRIYCMWTGRLFMIDISTPRGDLSVGKISPKRGSFGEARAPQFRSIKKLLALLSGRLSQRAAAEEVRVLEKRVQFRKQRKWGRKLISPQPAFIIITDPSCTMVFVRRQGQAR